MSTAQVGQQQKILVAGQWRASDASESFQSANPALNEALPENYPISSWSDCEAVLDAASEAAEQLRKVPAEQIAEFLEAYAKLIEANAEKLVSIANLETALPIKPRLADVELPRTTGQLRQAAAAARSGSWSMPTIDTKANIRSCYEADWASVRVWSQQLSVRVQQCCRRRFRSSNRCGEPSDCESEYIASRCYQSAR